MQQAKLVIARNTVKKGCELSFIREITGLSTDTIKKRARIIKDHIFFSTTIW